MNFAAIAHQSDSRFCYALGGLKARLVLRTACADPDLAKVELLYNTWTAFYREQIAVTMPVFSHDNLYDYFALTIEGKPDYVYVFRLTDSKGEVFYYSESGFTPTYDFAMCFLNEFFFAYPNPVDIIEDNPTFQGRLFYQIFPERFASADLKKDYINQKWGANKVSNLRYSGGDFKGITEHLPYLASLGVGAIYLNPIHPSSTAHMYDVEDYFGLNPKLGTPEDFEALVKEAHRLDIKIVLDLVFNHTSNKNPLFLDVVEKGRKSPYFDFYFVEGEPPIVGKLNYLSFCNVPTMPRLNTSNPKVQEYLCSIGEFWLNRYDVDGYRLDVAFDVSHAFWRLFKTRIAAIKPDAILIGEDWLNSESHLSRGEWDSVMNYPFRLALMETKQSHKDASWLADRLNGLLMRYTENSNRMMMNLLSSHDVPRWLTLMDGDRNFFYQSYALLMFYPGWPCLYYGDELLFEGGNDPDNRKTMAWEKGGFSTPEAERMKAILVLRKNILLRKGDWRILSEEGLFRVSRFLEGQEISLYLNLGDQGLPVPEIGETILAFRQQNQTILPGGFIVAEGKTKR